MKDSKGCKSIQSMIFSASCSCQETALLHLIAYGLRLLVVTWLISLRFSQTFFLISSQDTQLFWKTLETPVEPVSRGQNRPAEKNYRNP